MSGRIDRNKLQVQVGVVRSLEADVVPESDGGEAHEAKVQGLEVGPVLQGRVEGRRETGHGARGQRQVQHDPVNARLPVLQSGLMDKNVINITPFIDGDKLPPPPYLRPLPRRRVCRAATFRPWVARSLGPCDASSPGSSVAVASSSVSGAGFAAPKPGT